MIGQALAITRAAAGLIDSAIDVIYLQTPG